MTSLPNFIVPQQPPRKESRIKRLVQRAGNPRFALVLAVVLFASAGTAAAASHPQRVGIFRGAWNQVLADVATLPSDIAANVDYSRRVVLAPLDSLSEFATSILVGEKRALDVVSLQLADALRSDKATTVSALADAAQPFLVDVPDYSLVSIPHAVGPGTARRTLVLDPRNSAVSGAPEVLGMSTTMATRAPDPISVFDIQGLISQTFQSMQARGLLTGPKGDKGDSALAPGFTGPNGMVNNDNNKTTAVIGGSPIVTYIPAAQNFNGASLAGFTDLSADNFTAQAANIQGTLTVSGNTSIARSASVAGSFTAATSTLSALTVSGPATFFGNIAGNLGIGTSFACSSCASGSGTTTAQSQLQVGYSAIPGASLFGFALATPVNGMRTTKPGQARADFQLAGVSATTSDTFL